MRRSHSFLLRLLGAAVSLPLISASSSAVAQVSQPVVQAIPGGDGMRLNAALGRLARNPRDIDALIEAGSASIEAGDGDAAIGFYQKADSLSPNNARVLAGLAGAYVLSGDPASAIPLFDRAEKAGTIDAARVSDRGLAFDMIGDAVTAQRYYREALMAGPSDEVRRRFAISQAISRDRLGMESTLGPLLQRQDKAAWRTRAFSLAILGQVEEADSIARSTMPPDLASAISNYLRYMPKLTAAQQAAAANLGRFPRAAEIGIDDPRFAALVRTRPVLASASQALTPTGAPLGRDDRKKDKKAAPAPVQVAVAPAAKPVVAAPVVAPPAPAPVTPPPVQRVAEAELVPYVPKPSVTPASSVTVPISAPIVAKPIIAAATPAPTTTPLPGVVALATPGVALTPAPAAASPQSGQATLEAPTPAVVTSKPSVQVAAPVPPPAPKPVAPAPKPRSLSEVFADLTPPSREAEPTSGAVDMRKLKAAQLAARAADEKAAKAAEIKAAALAEAECDAPDPKSAKTAKPVRGAKAKPATKTTAKAAPTQCKVVKDEKAKAPANPSRIWVQVATGRSIKGLGFDWRKMSREVATLFKGRKGYTSGWGQTNRLLTGPFESGAQANSFIAQLKKAGVDGAFVWNSPAGQVVDALAGD